MPYNSDRMTNILSYRRPHNDPTLDAFVDDVFKDYDTTTWLDPKGAPLALVIGVDADNSATLFSCHLDTVHRTGGRQVLGWDEGFGLYYKPDGVGVGTPLTLVDDQCLGADDGAGIWLLLEMIDAGVPGTYIFHYGEERGGIGSSGMVDHHSAWLKTFKRAVAFDRRGTTSVITHQGWGRCCSDTFGDALADALNLDSLLKMRLDDTGVFTDTANYVEFIPECTNISCGYEAEHTKGETLDFEWLCRLRDAVMMVDWEALPTERVAEPMQVASFYGTGWGSTATKGYITDVDRLSVMRYGDVLKWVKKHTLDPDLIADVLYETLGRMDVAEQELQNASNAYTGEDALPWGANDSTYAADEDDVEFDPRLDVGMR